MTVRAAYPNVIAEVAEGLGIGVFQRIIEVELHGKRLNSASLEEVASLSNLKKLIVGPTDTCKSGLAHFHRARPDVQVVQTDYGIAHAELSLQRQDSIPSLR